MEVNRKGWYLKEQNGSVAIMHDGNEACTVRRTLDECQNDACYALFVAACMRKALLEEDFGAVLGMAQEMIDALGPAEVGGVSGE